MKTRHFLIAAALFMCGQCYAQSGRAVHGIIMDSLKRPLPWGIVKLVSEKRDSMVVTADENGQFVFHPVKGKQITVTEYPASNTAKRYHFTLQRHDTDVGNIIIENLKNVVAWGIDTIQYVATAYVVHKNTKMDSLLKKMPGPDIDTNSYLTHLGEKVTKVRIKGEDFPRADIQTAIKNLPPDIVEKIQVMDDYGDQPNLTAAEKALDTGNDPLKIAPIIYKEDTIVYNVAAYKTKGKGRLGDLLKKLPGLQVDADGKISAQGQPVIRFSVYGKTYSDNKWKRALKNMHADLISKVLVIDDYGNAAQNSFKNPGPEKIIDIITKTQ